LAGSLETAAGGNMKILLLLLIRFVALAAFEKFL